MSNQNILIVEDEGKIAQVLRDYLEKAGFRVAWLDRGDKVLPLVKQDSPDLILLDLMLPGKDGLELCREIRKFSQVPIIMLTARVEELERVLGLELGADDYICKPFSPREVVARIKSVLRRLAAPPLQEKLVAGPLSLDEQRHQVLIAGRELSLTPSEFGILKVLLAHPHRVFSRGELSAQVQGYNFEGYDRTIDTHVKNLRKKIDAILPGQEIIKTVYGIGYKLNKV
ncbi:MAG: response regulator [Syntrophales bacterium]|nr:response regulator [Syntrophales bacterium]MDD5642556.1 response regulator [Syntrophales bacterium]